MGVFDQMNELKGVNSLQLLTKIQTYVPPIDEKWLTQYLDPALPRYHHILGVVNQMENLLPQLSIPEEWQLQLLQACYLHDVGYSPKLKIYDYHQIDGAIFTQKNGFPKPIIAAVLFHSCAYEGAIPSRSDLLDIYKQNQALLDEQDRLFIDLVSYCDLHTSATGKPTTLLERIHDVIKRYGPDHEVSMIMVGNTHHFQKIIKRVHALLHNA